MGHFEWMNWRLSPILFASSSTSLLHLLPLPAHGMSAAFLNPLATDKASITLLEACQREPPIAIADCQQGPLSKQQTPFLQVAQRGPLPDLQRIPEPPEPIPEPLPLLPPPEELLDSDGLPPDDADEPSVEDTFTVAGFDIVGSTVFAEAELAAVTAPYIDRPLTFAELLDLRAAITQLYVDEGYITSGAIVPPQTFQDGGVVQIRVIEGRLEEIQVNGTQRLQPGYVSSRIAVGTSAPLNVDRLLERLQLLQLNPLIETITADLQAGIQPGINTLVITVVEAESFDATYSFDNNRSPSVGSARHQIRLTEGNLLGLGDRLSLGYGLTEGSDAFDVDYTLPINPYNGTLRFTANFNGNEVIEDPFDVLEIESDSDSYQLTMRQPILQTPNREVAVGLSASHQRSQTALGIGDIGPFPLSPGADEAGRTRVSALRFFQEWTQRNSEQVVALRSRRCSVAG